MSTAAEPTSDRARVHAVTGPYSYTGRYIAQRLQQAGVSVRGLVRRPPPDGVQGIECKALQFTDRDRLTAALAGVDVLHNSYWIRCPLNGMTFDYAVENTRFLRNQRERSGLPEVQGGREMLSWRAPSSGLIASRMSRSSYPQTTVSTGRRFIGGVSIVDMSLTPTRER